jgi:hypothetical protein
MTITPAAGSVDCGCTADHVTGGAPSSGSSCGCASGQGGASCGCGCQRQGSPRPRFFAGQLLTEDDLEALTAYVTAKSRLHTRYLAGSGVVCGLEVTCDPCGGGTVRVKPGYALDCCGRDILVACPTKLDINAMIRDLRLSQLGTDCGDPCPPTTTTQGQIKRQAHEPTRHYCLYVRYEEQLADPVAPYITEEPCGQPACEPTRVYEGYQFLLRCQAHPPPSSTIADALRACIDQPRIAQLTGGLTKYATPLQEAAQPTEPLPFDSRALATATRDLAKANAQGATTAELARAVADGIQAVAAQLVRPQWEDDATRQKTFQSNQQVIDDAQKELASATTSLVNAPDDTWPDPLDRQAAQALLAQAQQLADPRADQLNLIEARMLAQRAPFDREVWSVLLSGAAELRDWLLCRLDDDPLLTDCELRSAAEKIRIAEGADADKTISREGAETTARLANTLEEVLARYQRNCICAALNPPCPECDDPNVLLACLEVRDCAVVRICSTVRDWVISGPALNYWIPQLAELHQILEAYCCGPGERRADLATEGLLPRPLAVALGKPEGKPITDQLSSLRADFDQLARQFATTRRELNAAKGRITSLSQARQKGP